MLVMNEERNLCGAIAHLAERNGEFAAEYDADPQSAVDKYIRALGAGTVNSGYSQPKVDTRTMQQYDFTIPRLGGVEK